MIPEQKIKDAAEKALASMQGTDYDELMSLFTEGARWAEKEVLENSNKIIKN